MFKTQTWKKMQCRSTTGMYKYVGHHYILISLTFPQLAQPTSQDASIRPNSSPEPKSGQLLTSTSDLMKDAAALCHSVQCCRYTALCGLAPASLHFEAVWWSQVEGSPGGMKAYVCTAYPARPSRQRGWKIDPPSWACSVLRLLLHCMPASLSTHPWWFKSLLCPLYICSISLCSWLIQDVPYSPYKLLSVWGLGAFGEKAAV